MFNVAKYDAVTGEIAGVFESIQPSDTDLGSKAPKDVKITGLWYAQLRNAHISARASVAPHDYVARRQTPARAVQKKFCV